MMNSTYLRNLLLAVVCLFAGVSAKAQFSGAVEQYPTTDYSSKPITFSLTEVATALGTDTLTLGPALRNYIGAATPDPILLYAVTTEGDVAWSAAVEADAHGFWMDAAGVPVGWGDNAKFYASPDVDGDTFAFYVGQMPEKMAAGETAKATLKVKFNDKEATFALTLNVIAKPDFDVPEPTVIEKNLQIVGQQEKVVEQFPRGDYSSDVVKVNIAEALTALGITNKEGMAENIGKVLYTTWYNSGDVEQGGGMKKDSLTNAPTGEGHGFWYRPVQNAEGLEDGEVSATGWGDTDKFYMNNFTYTAADDSLQCALGQYPGSCKENETWFANVYIIYGEKAYLIKYTLKVQEKAQGNGLADYTKVGEFNNKISQEPTTDYSSVRVNVDIEAVAAALGCEVSAIGMVALDDKDNFAGSTGERGGFWFTKAGTVTSWGSSAAICVNPVEANDYSKFDVCQYPGVLQIGDEVSAYLYFTNGTNYYAYTITLSVTEPQKQEFEFESVETRSFAVQAVPTTDYSPSDLITISAESIEAAIGTTTPTLYGLNIDSVAVVKGTYSNAYSCDPKPGFWLNKDGRVSVWGDADARVGISWVDNSIMRFFQHSNRCAVGDIYKTQLFLVNEETNKMITVNITLNIVESLEQKEVVGEENIVIPVSADGVDIDIDLSKPAEALGVTVDDLLNSNNYYLRGMAAGAYAAGVNCENGLSFAANGEFDGYGNIYFSIAKAGDKVVLSSGSNDPVADDFNAKAQFCFEVNNKQYVYYATLASQAWIANGIEQVNAANQKAGVIYDLQGRQVVKAQRGLYIQNGRKYIVK